jgi:50S ribosomal protein L16 3-hydroxylase
MEPTQVLSLLGGLSPNQFMRRHWQKKPLLVRQAIPGFKPVLSAAQLFALAARDEVESRLITRSPERRGRANHGPAAWQLRRGPFARRALPPLAQPGWTLLVQGVDLHSEAAHELMQRFRFIPDARLDDLMISYASEGGGVGPHFDSYDVFLLQASGSRRWQIRACKPMRRSRSFAALSPSRSSCCMPAICSTCPLAMRTMGWRSLALAQTVGRRPA